MKYRAITTTETGERKETAGELVPDLGERENDLIVIYPEHTDQVWEGFGGAVTDSTAYVWSLMPPDLQREVIDSYFSENGLGYCSVRVPIDSCDFSLEQYEAAPDGKHFDMTRPLRYILPMLSAIRDKTDISLMLSPWSPPAAYKTNGLRHNGGKCRPERLTDWAEYICRYIREFGKRGFRVRRISLQNEPHAVQTWDSCVWDAAAEKDFLIRHMKPALLRNGYGDIEVYIWDHNKEHILERSLAVLDGEGRACADGIAFHWYSGDHFDALRKVHELFPEKKLILSENCIEYSKFGRANQYLARTMIVHEIMGDMENGTNAFLDWNLLLDEKGGPNYVGNFCHAAMLYDMHTRKLEKQSTFYALWHFAHFIPHGSVRILTSSFRYDVEKTAFLRPDGRIALVLQNHGERREVYVKCAGDLFAMTLDGKSLTTVVIEQ